MYRNDSFCINHYNDGLCDSVCNNVACRNDGTDCSPPQFVGVIIIFVLMPPEELKEPEISKEFLRFVSDLLRTVVVFVKEDGVDKILTWDGVGEALSFRKKRASSSGG